MTGQTRAIDAVVVGGGFYGCVIALYLASERRLPRVVLLEREAKLMQRASLHNQARVHNGYHYPRSFSTAFRSRVNLPRFVRDWPHAIKKDFVKLYAIARRNSKVTARQFERFCQEIGAPIQLAEPALQRLFEPRLIEKAYMVQEYAFDATRLAQWAQNALQACGVEVRYGAQARAVWGGDAGRLRVTVHQGQRDTSVLCRYLFNCTYSGLNQLGGHFVPTRTPLKHEVAEMALVEVPESLRGLGVTVMDGPFFSLMPFPARGLHTLSHVRYTPHFSWPDEPGAHPYDTLQRYSKDSRVDRMIRDVGRYLPAALQATPVESLFEVKTVLVKNEMDDGRPILYERHAELPGCFSVLGGKLDNIYDVIEKLDGELISPAA